MAIEIKELYIKISVEEENTKTVVPKNTVQHTTVDTTQIVKQCTRDVLEILKERQER